MIKFFKKKSDLFFCILVIALTTVFVLSVINLIERIFIYPIFYYDEIKQYSKEYGVEEKLVLSVIKAESGFDSLAESEKGAKGLMQISGDTASFIAKQMLNTDEKPDLFDPKTNIMTGCAYLEYLYKKFETTETVIVAYNAGEGNVKKWLKDTTLSKDGKTLDKIPYKETEEYLIRVKKNYNKYKKLYGKLLDKT